MPRNRSWSLAFALLLAADSSQALYTDLFLNAAETRVSLVSGSFDVELSPITEITIPIAPQGGLPGTTPGVLPGGGLSDGLTTAASGSLLVDLVLDPVQSTFSNIESNASLGFLTASGAWLPGPGGSGAATAAAAGFAFTDAAFGIDGRGALRDVVIGLGGQLFLTPDGPGAWSIQGLVDLSVLVGWLDYDAGLPGFAGTSDIAANFSQGQSLDGRYEILPSGIGRLSLPFTAEFHLFFAGEGFPIQTDFALGGEIVAYTQPIPEPGTALFLMTGLACLRWAAQRRPEGA